MKVLEGRGGSGGRAAQQPRPSKRPTLMGSSTTRMDGEGVDRCGELMVFVGPTREGKGGGGVKGSGNRVGGSCRRDVAVIDRASSLV